MIGPKGNDLRAITDESASCGDFEFIFIGRDLGVEPSNRAVVVCFGIDFCSTVVIVLIV